MLARMAVGIKRDECLVFVSRSVNYYTNWLFVQNAIQCYENLRGHDISKT